MDTTIFDWMRGRWPDKVTAWDLGKRPVRPRHSDARVLDMDTAIVAGCEPRAYQSLSRQWHDQDTARSLDEALHQLELERASCPPVIEVTVTAPAGGIARPELAALVREKVAEFTGGPAGQQVPARGARKVLVATRRARDYLLGDPPPVFPPPDSPAGPPPGMRTAEDDTPTEELPVVREVQVP